MIIKGSEIFGLEIVNKNRVKTGYIVKDIIYTKKSLSVVALVLKQQFDRKESLNKMKAICFNKILEIDGNNISILNEKSIITLKQRPDVLELVQTPTKVIGYEIYTKENELIGIVKDTIIDKKNGKVLALELSEGIFTDLYKGYSIFPLDQRFMSINTNSVVIDELILDYALHYNGGLKKLFGLDNNDN